MKTDQRLTSATLLAGTMMASAPALAEAVLFGCGMVESIYRGRK